MKRILVAVDPQHNAAQAIARAAQLSAQHGAAATIHYVLEGIDAVEQREQRAMEQHAHAALEALVATAKFSSPPALLVEFGVPHRCVVAALAADIIVIGPGQPSTVIQRVFGSTADRILRSAPVPVLVVRNETAQQYRSVAVAIDFSPLSAAALEATQAVAPIARIALVHAFEVPLPFEQAMLRAGTRSEDVDRYRRSRIRDCRSQLLTWARTRAAEADTSVLPGLPGETLVELSRSGDVDLIALGTQGRNAVAQALLGSVARRLLCEAGCDVLVAGPDHN
ncbi:universal stress protein [Brevundimonas diminuta]|uniref:universal stress protein n=1 Tax=Brevundimonas diminuta TaxID=293 RepID=UPI0022B01610|nr:universal stress protein [Brevundimonas diminuta]MCZ4107051.1 universal stress protein [Brevundimonas diminuta]